MDLVTSVFVTCGLKGRVLDTCFVSLLLRPSYQPPLAVTLSLDYLQDCQFNSNWYQCIWVLIALLTVPRSRLELTGSSAPMTTTIVSLTLSCRQTVTHFTTYWISTLTFISTEVSILKCFVPKKKCSPVTGLEWPRGFQEVKVHKFHDNGTGWW